MNVNALTPEQKSQIEAWVAEGQDLNALQKSINNEFQWKLTFMDTRFLILDLGLELQTARSEPTDPEQQEITTADMPDASAPDKLELSVNEITRPGMLISGDVKFPSGAYGAWFIDTQYRMGLDPAPASPEPTEEDMQIFQREIKGFLRNHMGGL